MTKPHDLSFQGVYLGRCGCLGPCYYCFLLCLSTHKTSPVSSINLIERPKCMFIAMYTTSKNMKACLHDPIQVLTERPGNPYQPDHDPNHLHVECTLLHLKCMPLSQTTTSEHVQIAQKMSVASIDEISSATRYNIRRYQV